MKKRFLSPLIAFTLLLFCAGNARAAIPTAFDVTGAGRIALADRVWRSGCQARSQG